MPVDESLQAVPQDRHGSLGESILDALQSTAACLHKDTEKEDFCSPMMPVLYIMTIAEIAIIMAIMTMYSNDPCARAMIKDRDKGYKKLSRTVHQVVPFMYSLSAAHFSARLGGLCQL